MLLPGPLSVTILHILTKISSINRLDQSDINILEARHA